MDFYKYLKECREEQDLTQEELVNALYIFDQVTFEHLDTGTLSRWERGSTKPNTLKQLSIIKYFQKNSGEALPCWHHYSSSEVEDLICTAGVHNILGKSKNLILNFPSQVMEIDDLKVYPIRDIQKAHPLFELNMDLHHAIDNPYAQVTLEQFETWAKSPSNLFLACEYKESLMGLFFAIKVKVEIFEKLLSFEKKVSDLREEDFATNDERGSVYLLSLYALNHKVAEMLFVRHFAYLIANQRTVEEIGISTVLDEVKKIGDNMNLVLYKEKRVKEKKTDVSSYRQSLHNILATEYVTKMIFSI